jgi:zinc protease
MEDIRAMQLDEVRGFYRTYYAPSNATLVVVGAVAEAELLALVERHYGGMAAADIPAPAVIVEPPQAGERRVRFAKPTAAARLLYGYRAVGMGHADWPVLSFAAALLSSGPSSRLYRRLVAEKEIATSVDCDLAPFRDPALFRISVLLTRDHTPEDAEAEIADILSDLASNPVGADELDKVRSVVETDFWSDLEGVDGRAEALGHYQTVLGDYRRLFAMAEALSKVSAADLRRAFAGYLVPEQRSVVVIDPELGDEDAEEER